MSQLTQALIRKLGRGAGGAGGPVQAVWHGTVIAESDRTIKLEGNHYFPPADVRSDLIEPSRKRTVCPWKGTARYYDVVVDGERNPGAAWYYPNPSPAADQIRGHVAFWRGVKVRRAPSEELAA